MSPKTKSITASVILLLITGASLGLSCALHRNTIVEWWKPVVLCAMLGCIAGLPFAKLIRVFSGWNNKLLTIIAGIILTGSVFSGSFYALNFYKSDPASNEICTATVTKKYSKKHYKTRRISRNRAVRGEPYNVYYIVMKLPDNRIKTIEVSVGEYSKIRQGQDLSLKVEKGFLGVPVIKNLSLPVRKHKHRSVPSTKGDLRRQR